MNETRNKLVERYLSGKASNTELVQLEELMENDSSFKQEVLTQRVMKGAIRAKEKQQFLGEMNELFDEILQPQLNAELGTSSNLSSTTKKAKVKSLFPKRFAIGVAAAITLLLASVFIFNQQQPSQQLYAEAFQPFRISNTRSEVDKTIKAKLSEAYNRGDYSQAKEWTNKLLNSSSGDQTEFQLILANCQLNLDENEEAIQTLKALAHTSGEYQEDAQWYLALAYLKTDDLKPATQVLKGITKNIKHLYHIKAQTLLEQVEQIK